MKTRLQKLTFICLFVLGLPVNSAFAHHSFAIYDFQTQIPFDGIVVSVKFRNPHIAMVLKVKNADGSDKLIQFVEGAPANMLVRDGLRPELVASGTHIIATGSPSKTDPTKYFLRVIKLDDGREFK